MGYRQNACSDPSPIVDLLTVGEGALMVTGVVLIGLGAFVARFRKPLIIAGIALLLFGVAGVALLLFGATGSSPCF